MVERDGREPLPDGAPVGGSDGTRVGPHDATPPGPSDGHQAVALPRTERPDAPAYLRAYQERRGRGAPDMADGSRDGSGDSDGETAETAAMDPSLPLYLRRFRARGAAETLGRLAPPVPGDVVPDWTEAWAQTSRSNDLVLPPELRRRREVDEVVDVHFMRHGETQGYSANAGLTPMGRWQAHRRGLDLSKGVRNGQSVRIVCAPTARAIQTAEQLRRGVEDGLAMWAREAPVEGPVPMDEFRNFSVWTPSGEMDITSAFREYHAVSERYEREAAGDRPLWLVEIDRFYRIQMGGGDAIHYWMTVPMANFEPPAAVILRFWAGIAAAVQATPVAGRVFVPTHSGPIRALATWALGHDAGEPYNVEEVRIRVQRSLRKAQVTYRNRTSEIQVPGLDQRPSWWTEWAAAADVAASDAQREADEEIAAAGGARMARR